MSFDPTQSTEDRERWAREFRNRWQRVDSEVEQRLETDDSLDPQNDNVSMGFQSAEYHDWMEDVIEREVLEPMPSRHVRAGSHHTGREVRHFYEHGLDRANELLRQEGYDVPDATGEEILRRERFDPDIHLDYLEQEFVETYHHLDRATRETIEQSSDHYESLIRGDVLAVAAALGLSLRELGVDDATSPPPPPTVIMMAKNRMDKVGETRTDLIAMTKSIETINDAALNRYDQFGVTGLRVDVEMVVDDERAVEFWTAGDDLVCPRCNQLDGALIVRDELDDTQRPPLHPNCRCFLRPERRLV